MSQNNKEKINKKNKENYIFFMKIVLSKLHNYFTNIKRISFNNIINYSAILKLKNFIIKYLMENIIIKKLRLALEESSSIYNEAIYEEINDDEFLNDIDLNQNKNFHQKYSIKDFENNLNKIKNINKELKEIENKIQIFTNKIIDTY